jgi:hypothetical protein
MTKREKNTTWDTEAKAKVNLSDKQLEKGFYGKIQK